MQHRDGLTGLSQAEERHAAVLGHLLVVANKVRIAQGICSGSTTAKWIDFHFFLFEVAAWRSTLSVCCIANSRWRRRRA